MTKLATSAMGLLLLNPISCSGTAHSNNGNSVSTGGSSGVIRCSAPNATECPPSQICKQIMFPILPPQGYDGGIESALLGECVSEGQGGGGTGGVSNTGGSGTIEITGGTTGMGGSKAVGGTASSGGATVATGGATANGGSNAAGGTVASGGMTGITGGAVATGGSSSVIRCSVMVPNANDCPPNQICVQTMFPVMPPGGFGGNVGSDHLGECRLPVNTGGAGSTGGVANTGGSSGTTESTGGKTTRAGTKAAVGGATALMFPISSQTGCGVKAQSHDTRPHEPPLIDEDGWWQTAEAALRRT